MSIVQAFTASLFCALASQVTRHIVRVFLAIQVIPQSVTGFCNGSISSRATLLRVRGATAVRGQFRLLSAGSALHMAGQSVAKLHSIASVFQCNPRAQGSSPNYALKRTVREEVSE